MTTELTGLEDDPRGRQAFAEWANALLRLRSRPIRLAAQCGLQGVLGRRMVAPAEGRPGREPPVGTGLGVS